MADHYRAASEQLARVADIRVLLESEYAKPGHRRERMGKWHAELGNALKLAEIHSTLAVAQAVHDLQVRAGAL